jgi:hypothetical protein
VLLAQVTGQPQQTTSAIRLITAEERAVYEARQFAATNLRDWEIPDTRAREIVLLVSDLVTNAVRYGQPPIELRMLRTPGRGSADVTGFPDGRGPFAEPLADLQLPSTRTVVCDPINAA